MTTGVGCNPNSVVSCLSSPHVMFSQAWGPPGVGGSCERSKTALDEALPGVSKHGNETDPYTIEFQV